MLALCQTPRLVDADNDGLLDLIYVKDARASTYNLPDGTDSTRTGNSNLYFAKNVGTNTKVLPAYVMACYTQVRHPGLILLVAYISIYMHLCKKTRHILQPTSTLLLTIYW